MVGVHKRKKWPVPSLFRGSPLNRAIYGEELQIRATYHQWRAKSVLPCGVEQQEVGSRAFQNPGFSAESGIYPDISGYIRWNLLAIQCESETEDTAGKLTSCSGFSWKD